MPNTPKSPVSPLILHARRLGTAWSAETGSINPDGMTACLTFAGSAISGILLKMSNCYCHPGRAGGTPDGIRTIIFFCGVLAGLARSEAQPANTARGASDGMSQETWWEQGWGFAAPGVHQEQNPAVRRRLAGLFHLAHAGAAA